MHKILARQLKRLNLSGDFPPDKVSWKHLLDFISRHYEGMDDEHYLMERAVELSSREMELLNEQIYQTSESQITAERDKLKSVFESLSDGVCEVNMDGKIIFINHTGIEFLHGTLEEIYQLEFFKLFQLHHPTKSKHMEWNDLLELIQSGQVYRDDNAFIIKINHRILPISCIISPVFHQHKISSIVFVFRDISQQKQIEKQLVQATKEAEYAYRAKSDFLATMSHEIRTPLNGVIGMASILHDTELDSEQQEYVDTLKHSGETLLSLINDILDFSKIEAGKLELESIDFNLQHLVQETKNLFAEQFTQKNISLTTHISQDCTELVCGSPTRIQQVLINLLGNALKFTFYGQVSLTVSRVEEQPDHYQFSVKDSGIGIAEENQIDIFEAFCQADSTTTRKYGGSGLGLSISKRLVEMMQGTIGLHSEIDRGSEFFFTARLIPALTDTAGLTVVTTTPVVIDEQPSTTHSDKPGQYKILVVDDNKVNQMIAQKFIAKINCVSDSADNGLAALESVQTNDYDLILMDCQMPEMDGYEATQKIREFENQSQSTSAIPIIAMTANTMEGDREKCLAAGMDDYVSKPINQTHLTDTINKWLGKKST
jgi:PAS domain S-box-containing protein